MQDDGLRLSATDRMGEGSHAGAERPYVHCRDLFKIFKPADLEVVALRGVDLDIEGGELIAIVGASGSGKSTLLNILAGLEKPWSCTDGRRWDLCGRPPPGIWCPT